MSQLINGFNAVRFFVSDLNRAVDFYKNTLGLQLSAHEESLTLYFNCPTSLCCWNVWILTTWSPKN